MPNAITGENNHLLSYLARSIEKANNIRIIVAFLMESGAKLIAPDLKKAVDRGVKIQLLTGKYMSITQPSAIYYLLDYLGEEALDIRFYMDNLRSFHPKAYIFEFGEEAEIFVGSSNLSLSALTSGIEWNYRFFKTDKPEDYNKFSITFDELFNYNSIKITPEVLKSYAANWKKPTFVRIEDSIGESVRQDTDEIPKPRGAQIEALYELRRAREEGISKGLVVAATGVGKTYLAAFDSVDFQKVLFVAHREEIIKQAEKTFKMVRPEIRTGFFTGSHKDDEADIYFATVQTLTKVHNLELFNNEDFDYIVVDEFHHAAADSYLNIINYFNPKFLLGLTATPYRMDNRDLFALCDDNVIYEIYLKDAINRDLLVPFKYYGVYDETDYSQIEYRNGKYVIDDLERQLSRQERADLVLENYRKFSKARTLGFCVSISHAEYMAEFFSKNGVPSVAVHSYNTKNKYVIDRAEAISLLNDGKIRVIFAVDIFNEGVDIPSLDTVMFLRPTESFVVFLQQLGRGLRKHEQKDYLIVLDFIGNYKKAHYIPALLAGENPMNRERQKEKRPDDYEYPEGCHIQFDFKVLDLFSELTKRDPLAKRMKDEFYRLKNELGRRPTRLDIYEGIDIPIREFLKRGWLEFLSSIEELSDDELVWIGTPTEEFLREIEKTGMTKSYKIPTVGALLQGDTLTSNASLEQVGENFMHFYKDFPLHQKDLNDKSNQNWKSWSLDKFTALARQNPVHFLSKGRFFNYDEVNKIFYLDESLHKYINRYLAEHVKDILEYKRKDYFRKRFKEEQ